MNKLEKANYEYHLPVLPKESISYLINNKKGIYLDGTLGGGGHSELILQKLLSGGKLIAFDKDKDAIEHCRHKFANELAQQDSRLILINESYTKACSIAEELPYISGLLLDLGVSSKHFDSQSGGFSYRSNSPLDMRFYPEGITAKDLLNSATEEELERIIRVFGEEPFSLKIARRIVEVRRGKALQTTFDLKEIVESIIPSSNPKDSLSRVFQAFRIAINDELGELERMLNCILPHLEIGARIVVIAYHSLEDRIVKNFFKEHSKKIHKNKYKSIDSLSNNMPSLKILTKSPIIPSKDEQSVNLRSRSAKMRVAERV
jgi:16S rRNA (cytosine1402-N4)-methyltransferase